METSAFYGGGIYSMTEFKINQQLPIATMHKATKGIFYLAHPLRLRILEYLDVMVRLPYLPSHEHWM